MLANFCSEEYLSKKKDSLKQGMKNAVVCLQVIIKMNEVFDYKNVVEFSLLQKFIEIEEKHSQNSYVWSAI